MERVTAEPPTPLAQGNKDPKKQAAGRAGAAARKAKQEKILDELRNAKAAMREQSDVATAASANAMQGNSKEVPSVKPYEDAVHQPMPSAVAKSPPPDDSTPYIFAGLVALGGLALVIRDKRTPNNSSPPPTVNPPRPRAPTAVAPLVDSHLKLDVDPFIM